MGLWTRTIWLLLRTILAVASVALGEDQAAAKKLRRLDYIAELKKRNFKTPRNA